jgi:hypothetical protein
MVGRNMQALVLFFFALVGFVVLAMFTVGMVGIYREHGLNFRAMVTNSHGGVNRFVTTSPTAVPKTPPTSPTKPTAVPTAVPSLAEIAAKPRPCQLSDIARFLEQHTKPSKRHVPVADVYAVYLVWCRRSGILPKHHTQFGQLIRQCGLTGYKQGDKRFIQYRRLV